MAGFLLPLCLDGAVHHGAGAIQGQLGRAGAPHGHLLSQALGSGLPSAPPLLLVRLPLLLRPGTRGRRPRQPSHMPRRRSRQTRRARAAGLGGGTPPADGRAAAPRSGPPWGRAPRRAGDRGGELGSGQAGGALGRARPLRAPCPLPSAGYPPPTVPLPGCTAPGSRLPARSRLGPRGCRSARSAGSPLGAAAPGAAPAQ